MNLLQKIVSTFDGIQRKYNFRNTKKALLTAFFFILATISFQVSAHPNPGLLSPANGAVVTLSSSNPCFEWSDSPDAAVSYYNVTVSTTSDFTTTRWQNQISGSTARSVCWNGGSGWLAKGTNPPASVPTALSVGVTYYWRVVVGYSDSLAGQVTPLSFTVQVPPPAAHPNPGLISPANGEVVALSGTNPCFQWSDTPDAPVSYYNVTVSTTSDFTTTRWQNQISGSTARSVCWNGGSGWLAKGTNPPTSVPSTLSEGVTYYWRVVVGYSDVLAGQVTPLSFTAKITPSVTSANVIKGFSPWVLSVVGAQFASSMTITVYDTNGQVWGPGTGMALAGTTGMSFSLPGNIPPSRCNLTASCTLSFKIRLSNGQETVAYFTLPSVDIYPPTISSTDVIKAYSPWVVSVMGSQFTNAMTITVYDNNGLAWGPGTSIALAGTTGMSFSLPGNFPPSSCNLFAACSLTFKLRNEYGQEVTASFTMPMNTVSSSSSSSSSSVTSSVASSSAASSSSSASSTSSSNAASSSSASVSSSISSSVASSTSSSSSSSSSSLSIPAFDFNSQAPSNFTYSLGASGVPELGATQSVATTQGDLSVTNGAAQYSVAIDLPPAIRDLKPKLSLGYNSRSGNGLMGMGWNLSGLSGISRCRASFAVEGVDAQKSNPRYSQGDRLCLDGQKLVLANVGVAANDANYWASGAQYKTEIDNFSKIVSYGSSSNGGPAYFKVWTKDGRVLTYGGEDSAQNSRIYAPGQANGPVSTWVLDKAEDAYGNSYTITYDRDTANGDYRPLRINFAPEGAVVFTYQDRAGQVPGGYDKGNVYQSKKVLDYVTTYIGVTYPANPEMGTPVKKYDIDYQLSAGTQRELVKSITECGYNAGSWQCAKPLAFEWQAGEVGFNTGFVAYDCTSSLDISYGIKKVADFDGDGFNDLLNDGAISWGTAAGCFQRGKLTDSITVDSAFSIKSFSPIRTLNGYAFLAMYKNTAGATKVFLIHSINKATGSKVATLLASVEASYGASGVVVADYNNDGLDDFSFGGYGYFQQATATPTFISLNASVSPLGANTKGEGFYLDVNGDGIKDRVTEIPNVNPLFSSPAQVSIDLYSLGVPAGSSSYSTASIGFDANQPQNYSVGGSGYSTNAVLLRGGMLVVPGDVNGDGNLDYMFFRKDTNTTSSTYGKYVWMYRLGNQVNTGPEINTHIIAVNVDDTGGYPSNRYAWSYDWDKDGRDDLLAVLPGTCTVRVLLSRGTANNIIFTELKNANGTTYITPLPGEVCAPVFDPQYATRFVGDINNDGVMDLYLVDGSFILGRTQRPDLLSQVTDGFGAQVKVEYSNLTGDDNNGKPLYTVSTEKPIFPATEASRNLSVVKKLAVSNGQGGFNNRFFNYTGAKVDLQGRGFLGFASITSTDLVTSLVTVTDFSQSYPYIGKVLNTTTKTTSGLLVSNVKNSYAVQSENARLPYLDTSVKQTYQLLTSSLSSPLSVTKVKNTFDRCGNLTNQITKVGSGFDGVNLTGELSTQEAVNDVNYYGTATDCTDDFVYRHTETATLTATAESKTATTEFVPNTAKEVYQAIVYKGTSVESTTTYNRAGNGVINGVDTAAKDIDSTTTGTRKTQLSNFNKGLYPTTTTAVLAAGNHVSTLDYDYRFGEVSSTIDPNGLSSKKTFDSLGRLIKTETVDGTYAELISFYCSSALVQCPANAAYGVATRVTKASSSRLAAPLSIVFYDSLQREIRRSSYSLAGNVVNVATEYRADGKIDRVSEPYTTSGSISTTMATAWTQYSNYDALGRANTMVGANAGSKTISYTKDGTNLKVAESVSLANSQGVYKYSQVTTRYINPLGQVAKVEDALGTPVNYSYDSVGNLSKTIVNNNSYTEVNIVHDIAGNQVSIADPDAGAISFDYNGFGELRRQIWQKGTTAAKSMLLSYDDLGRQIGRLDQPVSGASTSYTWTWDTKQKGLLTSQSGNGQTIEYGYDGNSRVSILKTSITGLADRSFYYTYDEFGRPETQTYPNGFRIKRFYHGNGLQVQTQDFTDSAHPQVLWAMGNDLDGRGNLINQLWGNGVVTQVGFDQKSGRINTITSGRLSSTNGVNNLFGDIQALSYESDSLGNLESRTSKRTNATGTAIESLKETYTYDLLNRLNTSSASGNLFSRTKNYNYDALGNLIGRHSFSELGNSVGPEEDLSVLKYDRTGNAGVHAITSAGIGINAISYGYDKYGNMTQRGSETVAYDVFNKPINISGTTTTLISYGADHERFKEVSDGTATYTMAGGLYEEIVSGSTSTQKSYVDGVVINTRVLNGGVVASNDTQYVHTDNLGSAEAISDRLGAFVTRMSFSDWGTRQQSDWKTGTPTLNFPTANGYTGHHELDKHKLVHMGGRVYDPSIGRFMSADLFIQSPYSTQSFNRYSYVSNNPMSRIDPTGYIDEILVTGSACSGGATCLTGETAYWFAQDMISQQSSMPVMETVDMSVVSDLYGYAYSEVRTSNSLDSDNKVDEIVVIGHRNKKDDGLSLSEAGALFIKGFEGYRDHPYKVAGTGNWTVGYGHEITASEYNSGSFNKITKDQADTLFNQDVSDAISKVESFIKNNNPNISLSQSQIDALVSLSLNSGYIGRFPNLSSNFAKGDMEGVAHQMLDITNNGMSGLVTRRGAEANLFLNSSY